MKKFLAVLLLAASSAIGFDRVILAPRAHVRAATNGAILLETGTDVLLMETDDRLILE